MKSYLEILEYDKLKNIIEKKIQTIYGKKALKLLNPTFDLEKAKAEFERMNEFFSFFYKWGSPVLDDIFITTIIQDSFNGLLTAKELLQIGNFLSMLNEMENHFKEHGSDLCTRYVSFDIPFLLLDEINAAIDEHGFIKDSATGYLFELRGQIKQLKEDITHTLKNIMHSRIREVISDTAIFLKRSRYTILMKPNFKEYINGRIIDIGKSGGFFVEPDSIYSLNNELEELILKEEAEKRRILTKITNMVRKNSSKLMYNEKRLGFLDLEIAKFEYAKNFEQAEIVFLNKPVLFAKKVKHPVLAEIKKDTKSVDINLKDNSSLIITGPNTGGKTVFLKTAGLIVLSIFSNIPPIGQYIEIGSFDNVFAVIGDEQDILESLSGFSAKMIGFKNIYGKITTSSLVLLDEIGGGTSPDEGEAVAYSIIKNLTNKCTFIATTHYKRLAYILSSKDYPIAAFEFDEKTLKPTYKLKYSQIGRSYGIEILKTLNMSDDIVNEAEEFHRNNETNFSKLEKELEKKLVSLNKKEISTEELRTKYERMILEEKKKLETARQEIVIESQKRQKEYEQLINRLQEEVSKILKSKNIAETHRALNKIKKEANELFQASQSENTNISYKIGEWVKFGLLEGQITAIKGEKAAVEIDGKIVEISLHRLGKTTKKENKRTSLIKHTKSSEGLEINLIGKRRNDAEIELAKFLDSAIMNSIKNVRIVHGIGSGILREMVKETLKNHPYIKSFHPAHPNEGGDGATIAEFK